MNGGDQLYLNVKEPYRQRSCRGKISQSKKVILALESKASTILEENTIPRLIHPNVCRTQILNSTETINHHGELETKRVWKFEFKPDATFCSFRAEYPQFRKKLLTDVLKGLVYLHENKLAHGDLNCHKIMVTKTDKGPNAIITFMDGIKDESLVMHQQKDIEAWGRLVCDTYTGKTEIDIHEVPPYMRRFVECAFKKGMQAKAILDMIEEENAQKEMDVQLAIDHATSISGLYNKLEHKYAQNLPPKGLRANFNEFRRY